jgi:hypothetical protein
LQHAGFVNEREWQQHQAWRAGQPAEAAAATAVAPVIRALRCGPLRCQLPTPPHAFPYLAHLPQLRELECGLLPQDLRALGLLTQLEELSVRLVRTPTNFTVEAVLWSNDTVRLVGELPLHHLHTLRLEDDSELSRLRILGLDPHDPDCPCQYNREQTVAGAAWRLREMADAFVSVCFAGLSTGLNEGEHVAEGGELPAVQRASFGPLTLDHGLRPLLNLRALTSLHLPWIETSEVDALHQLAQQSGGASLFIERIVPVSRRSLLQRHWIHAAALDDDDDE